MRRRSNYVRNLTENADLSRVLGEFEVCEGSPEESPRSLLRRAAEYLGDSIRTCRHDNYYEKKRRYVHLKTQEMFDSLVELYSRVFAVQWGHFKRTADSMNPRNTEPPQAPVELARLYISHWLLDLYNNNREAIGKLTSLAYTDFYLEAFPKSSNEYDVVLCHLSSCLRPTMVQGYMEDVMYLPRFADTIRWEDEKDKDYNPFQITGFRYNHVYFKAIIVAIKDKRAGWNTATLTNETVERPFWLFDWHDDHLACSWFPRKKIMIWRTLRTRTSSE